MNHSTRVFAVEVLTCALIGIHDCATYNDEFVADTKDSVQHYRAAVFVPEPNNYLSRNQIVQHVFLMCDLGDGNVVLDQHVIARDANEFLRRKPYAVLNGWGQPEIRSSRCQIVEGNEAVSFDHDAKVSGVSCDFKRLCGRVEGESQIVAEAGRRRRERMTEGRAKESEGY